MQRLAPRPIFLLITIAFFLTSCARMCGKMAYDNEITSSTSSFVYDDTSADKLWRETI